MKEERRKGDGRACVCKRKGRKRPEAKERGGKLLNEEEREVRRGKT